MTTTAETAELAEAAVELPENLLKCVKCGRPMRPRGVTKAEMPGTVATGHSGMCKSDAQPNGPGDRTKQLAPAKDETPAEEALEAIAEEDAPEPEEPVITESARSRRKAAQDVRLANTVAGLDALLARRRKRLGGAAFATEVRIVGRRAA